MVPWIQPDSVIDLRRDLFIHSLKAYSSTLRTHQRLSKVLWHSNERNGQGFCSPWACVSVYSRSSVLETRGEGRRGVWCTEGQGPGIFQDPAVTLANLHQTMGLPLGVSLAPVQKSMGPDQFSSWLRNRDWIGFWGWGAQRPQWGETRNRGTNDSLLIFF